MAKAKKVSKEFQCELFERVNRNCDRTIQFQKEESRKCKWREIKGFWLIALSIATVILCVANLALLFFLDKIYLF